jgi:MoxR-like ATPase
VKKKLRGFAGATRYRVNEIAIKMTERLGSAVLGNEAAAKLLVQCLLAGGHALVEGPPGVGKTSLALALAETFGGDFRRVQFTPDLMPSDVLGFNLYDQKQGDFRFLPGPVFCHLLLADEINRTSPRVQSALLECMSEGQVTVDGETHRLAQPFMVVATRNDRHQTGTFPLPESQLDRFLISIPMRLPDVRTQMEVLDLHVRRGAEAGAAGRHGEAVDPAVLLEARRAVRGVAAGEAVREYVVRLCQAARRLAEGNAGLSVRALLGVVRMAQAAAWCAGRAVVFPEDVKAVLPAVLRHRLDGLPESTDRDEFAIRFCARWRCREMTADRSPADGAFRVARLPSRGPESGPKLTSRGAAVLAASLAIAVVAMIRGDAPLAALGALGMVGLAVAAWAGWRNSAGLRIEADLPPEVFAEARFDLRMRIGRESGAGLREIRVEHTLPGGARLRVEAPWAPPGGMAVVEMQGSVPRRGEFGAHPVLVESRFPFGCFAVRASARMGGTMRVMPRPMLPREILEWIREEDPDAEAAQRRGLARTGELHGLRDYRPGDRLKAIHWPASSRGLGLLVRDDDPPQAGTRAARVVFHSAGRGGHLVRSQPFEMALRLFAGTMLAFHQIGVPVVWTADFADWREMEINSRESLRESLAGLATVKRAAGTPIEQLQSAARMPRDGVLVVVGDLPKQAWRNELRGHRDRSRWRALDADDIRTARPLPLNRKGGAW